MGPEWVAILALIALFVIGTAAADQHGRARVRRGVARRHVLPQPRREGDPGRHQRRPGADADRRHLSLRDRPAERHRRPDRAKFGEGRRRSRRADPVGDVRRHRGDHRDRCGQPGRLRDHRPDRPRLRRPLQDQPADDGHVRRPRRPGRWLLADLDLRHHHQLGDGGERPALQRDDDLPVQPDRELRDGRHPLLRARRPPADVAAPRPRRDRRRRRQPAARGGATTPAAPGGGGVATDVHRDRTAAMSGTGASPTTGTDVAEPVDRHPPRPDPDAARVRRRRHRRAGLRQEHRLRLDHRRGGALDDLPEGVQGHRQADRLADRAPGRRGDAPTRRSSPPPARRSSSATGPPAWVRSPSVR